jgi:hypothetical protein
MHFCNKRLHTRKSTCKRVQKRGGVKKQKKKGGGQGGGKGKVLALCVCQVWLYERTPDLRPRGRRLYSCRVVCTALFAHQ